LQQTTQDSLQHILQNKIVAIVRGIALALAKYAGLARCGWVLVPEAKE